MSQMTKGFYGMGKVAETLNYSCIARNKVNGVRNMLTLESGSQNRLNSSLVKRGEDRQYEDEAPRQVQSLKKKSGVNNQ